MKHLKTFESYASPISESIDMGKEEMIGHLCRCGYPMRELLNKDEQELESMYKISKEEGPMSEKKGEKWIQDTKMHKGALHKQLGYDEDEKIPAGVLKKIVDGEVGSKVEIKGKEKTITALMKKRANLAKTLKKLK